MVSRILTNRCRVRTNSFQNKMVKGKRRTERESLHTRSNSSLTRTECGDSLSAQPLVNGARSVVKTVGAEAMEARGRDAITNYFSPGRSPTAADDADIPPSSSMSATSEHQHDNTMKTARLARAASADVQTIDLEHDIFRDSHLAGGNRRHAASSTASASSANVAEHDSDCVSESSDTDDDCVVIDDDDDDDDVLPRNTQKVTNGFCFAGFTTTSTMTTTTTITTAAAAARSMRTRSQAQRHAPTVSSAAATVDPTEYSCCGSSCSSSCSSSSSCNSSDNGVTCDICDNNSSNSCWKKCDDVKPVFDDRENVFDDVDSKPLMMAAAANHHKQLSSYDITNRGLRTITSTKVNNSSRESHHSSINSLSSRCGSPPPVIDLTEPSDCSSHHHHPKLSHSSPTVRQLFTLRDTSDAGSSPTHLVSKHSSATKEDASRLPRSLGPGRSATPPPPSSPPACGSPSTPSTPHKIQVLEENHHELFLSPTAATAISKLSVKSTPDSKQPVAAKGGARTRGRKRLNIQSVELTSSAGIITGTATQHQQHSESDVPMKIEEDGEQQHSLRSARKAVSPAKLNGVINYHDHKQEVKGCVEETKNGIVRVRASKSACAAAGRPASTRVTARPKRLPTAPANNNNSKSDTHMTDYFPIRRSERKPKATLLYERQMDIEKKIIEGSEEGVAVEDFGAKGRGIVATSFFHKGEFVVEYVGELLDTKDAKIRETNYAMDSTKGCYMYYFTYNDVQYCIDGTEETSYMGRLVNHSRTNNNLVTKSVCVDSTPHLILCAKKDILPGTELLYDYGDRSKEALANHPWLAF